MSTCFVRLDLSPDARDFEVFALEPGMPLLDEQNTNYQMLKKWLGRLAAQPEWHGKSVEFYVCDDNGARLQNVKCEPVVNSDLIRDRGLKEDLEEIAARLKQVVPKSDHEIRTLKATLEHFQRVIKRSSPLHRECQFFKYRIGNRWHLVWGWGYQRKDMEPAPPLICTNPKCLSLFVRRSDGSRSCPACEGAAHSHSGTKSGKPWGWAALLLVAVIAAAAGYVVRDFWNPVAPPPSSETFVVEPADWSGPVGSRIDFIAKYRDSSGKETDASMRVVAVVENPKVVELDEAGTVAVARAPGKTVVHFYLGTSKAHATLQIKPPHNPAKIVIEPERVALGIGSTEQLRLFGEFEGGAKVDLTEAAEWLPVDGGNVYCYEGLLEGIAEGKATVRARYSATADEPALEAAAEVNVAEELYTSLELSLDPVSLIEGKKAKLKVQASTDSGVTRSLLNSSKLKLSVDPPQIASVSGEYLNAEHTGKAVLKAEYEGLSAALDIEIERDSTPGIFEVRPNRLALVVGESADLNVVTSSKDPISIVSSAPKIVEVLDGRQIVGRATGKATLTVSQEARRQQLNVEVTQAKINSIKFVPSRPKVPVDGSLQLRVVGSCDEGREVNLAADQLVWERLPQASFADLDVKTLSLRGRRPTDGSPQSIACRFRHGKAEATALVEVVVPPMQVEILPKGPVKLPEGQVAKLEAWAIYSNGRRVGLPSDRVSWHSDPAQTSGLELDPRLAIVRAKKRGVGPIAVYAEYLGSRSNRVEFRSVDPQQLSLTLKADRKIILAGDEGQLQAVLADPQKAGLALEAVRYKSSNPKLFDVNAESGAYRAMAPGDVTVAASHPAAKKPAELKLQIVDPQKVSLVFKPSGVKLRVNNRCDLKLLLMSGEQEQAVSTASSVRMAIGQPKAVSWNPPTLTALEPAKPFEITGTYRGKTARATVEVLPSVAKDGKTAAIRVVPATASLVPRQRLSPRVEQQLSKDGHVWQEVEPAKVQWKVPRTLVWKNATANLRPVMMLADAAKGTLTLEAQYGGSTADMQIDVKQKGETPSGPIVVVREPEGEELPVGRRQRYSLFVEADGKRFPAVDVRWLPAFEDDNVRWAPPVLYAKKQGHLQRLGATAAGRKVSFTTRIVGQPPEAADGVQPPSEKPREVRIASDQDQPITIPVRALFDDFRVEAVFEGGLVHDVTHAASLTVESREPGGAPLAIISGRIAGVRLGSAIVNAEFNGVKAKNGLAVVVGQVVPDTIEIVPQSIELAENETVDLRVVGFRGSGAKRKPLGDITSCGGLKWQVDKADIAGLEGPMLTGLKPGDCTVKATFAKAADDARVVVKKTGAGSGSAQDLELSPNVLHMKVDETKWIGKDVTLRRGEIDVSRQLEVTSSDPSIVRWNPGNRSLDGISPGRAALAITLEGQGLTLPVVVELPDKAEEVESVVIEPSAGELAVGQGLGLQVLTVGKSGRRTDRTGSSQLVSSKPDVLAVRGNRVMGMKEGKAVITARVAGSGKSAAAAFTVKNEKFTRLAVSPSTLKLNVGDEQRLRIFAVGPDSRCDLSGHPDLKLIAGGANPDSIELAGACNVLGIAPGRASITVAWRDLPHRKVDVRVVQQRFSEIRIAPGDATIDVDEQMPFVVFAKQGRYERALSIDDGVQVQVNDPSVAELGEGFTLRGLKPGTTQLAARIGSKRAVSRITVASDKPVLPRKLPVGLQFVPNVMTLQLGVQGASVRLVKVTQDGSQEDVDHQATVTIQPPRDIVDVKSTASGPVFLPKKEGKTTATARLGNLATARPLLIQVVDPRSQQAKARIEAAPNPLYLRERETGHLRRVQIIPGEGNTPIDVDYSIESSNPRVVRVDGGKTLRGISAGRARLTITPLDVGEAYKDLRGSVTVEVDALQESLPDEGQLLLTGPEYATVGAELAYRVELVHGDDSRDVTNDATALVLGRGQGNVAEARPGCTVLAKRPGTATIRAQHGELISSPVNLRIDQLPKDFVRLELECDRGPLAVDDTRFYKVWAYPQGGGARVDLTNMATLDRSDIERPQVLAFEPGKPANNTPLVDHSPPKITGKSPGVFNLAAALGPSLRSEVIKLQVVSATEGSGISDLRVEPYSISIRVGERTPRLQVVGRGRADRKFRPLNAQVASENVEILSPDAAMPGCFLGKALGKTRIRAAFGGREAFVEVSVLPNSLQSVTLDPRPNYASGGSFTVFVNITGTVASETELEYRLVTIGNPDAGEWKTATRSGNQLKVRLESPDLRQGPVDTVYHLRVQARAKNKQKRIAQYPLDFRLDPGTVQQK